MCNIFFNWCTSVTSNEEQKVSCLDFRLDLISGNFRQFPELLLGFLGYRHRRRTLVLFLHMLALFLRRENQQYWVLNCVWLSSECGWVIYSYSGFLLKYSVQIYIYTQVKWTSCLCRASSRSRFSLASLLVLSSSAFFLLSSFEAFAMFSKRALRFPAPTLAIIQKYHNHISVNCKNI